MNTRIVRDAVKKTIIRLSFILPLKEDVILESYPDFTDNAFAFYQYLLDVDFNKKHTIYWALHERNKCPLQLPENVKTFDLNAKGFRAMWQRFLALYRSKFILDGNSYIKKRRRGQIRIHLGHGMLIKITPDYHNPVELGEVDGFLTTADWWKNVFVDRVGLREEELLPIGYPRDDVIVREKDIRADGKPYILWLPTYRQHRNHLDDGMPHPFAYGMPEVSSGEELKQLDERLGQIGYMLYFRPHPAQELSVFKKETLDHIIVADDRFLEENHLELYEFLARARALITDYSSVYYDFLLTDRPIGLTIGDRQEYFSKYGCAFANYTDGVIGEHIESFSDLLRFVERVADQTQMEQDLSAIKERYHACTDGRSCERLYEYLREKYHFGE